MSDAAPKSWSALHQLALSSLKNGGVESPASEARWILESVSGLGFDALLIEEAPATIRAERKVKALIERRLTGEPLQYVLGEWSFRDLDLLVDPRVLIPRPETEILVEIALLEAVLLGMRLGSADPWAESGRDHVVVDLGTGSGAIAIALERSLPEAQVWATDVSSDALAVARANIAGTGATRVMVSEGAWFDALPLELKGNLMLVVSNPPYIAEHEKSDLSAEVIDWEPYGALISGPNGLEAIEEILMTTVEWLAPGGVIVIEHAPHQAEAVVTLAEAAGLSDARVHPDLTGRPRVLVARNPR
ncbi:protein-(glutamine-N5) methyltransferase, release factor-specific [Actinobacteria bacterium IMCC26256]|nr:protein-(glutamine-N5) methyltransferase, release factor-specific [Actinobacteria bacterium IMCC26256]